MSEPVSPNYYLWLISFVGFSGLCTGLGFLWKMVIALVGIQNAIGQKYPNRSGLLGDVEEIKDKQEEIIKKQSDADKSIAVIEANVAQRRSSDRDKKGG